jgi:hypothetical protein
MARSAKRLSFLSLPFGAALVCLALCWVSPNRLAAQLSTASVTGIVRDPGGAAIPRAEISLRNLDTTINRQTVSNDSGNYVFVDIPPGRYGMTITKTGFGNFHVNELVLQVDQTATLNATLNVGSVEQSVDVTASAELLQASTSGLGQVMETRAVVDLPLNGRNFTQLLTLTAGAAPISASQQSNGFGNTAIGSSYSFPAFNGQQQRSDFFMTDGINNQAAFASTYVVPPIIDAIQEFKVNSHDDKAEFGGALGGIVNVVTKSGTNEYHGDVWEYLRNTDLNARNTFNAAVTPFHQNQYGTTFGGPVWIPKLYKGTNRTFFFFGYESFRYTQAATTYSRVPTPLELSGNFTGPNEPAVIYNPNTTQVNPANPNTFVRTPFAGNIIPQSLIDPNILRYATLLPHPVFTGVSDRNAIDIDPTKQAQDQFTGRIDQTLGTKNFIWFRWSNIILDQTLPTGLTNLDEQTHNPGLNWGLSYVRTFSPSLIMQLSYGRTHQQRDQFTNWQNLPPGFAQSLNIAPNLVSSFADGSKFVPSIGVTGDFSGGEQKNVAPNEANIHEYKGDVTKVIGSHTLKFGASFAGTSYQQTLENAAITFDTPQTSNPANTAQIGSGIASLLLGTPASSSIRNVNETTRPGGVLGLYVQDSWKVNAKLTVNAGLRYDLTLIPPYGTNGTIGKQGGIETGDYNFNDGTYIVQVVPPSCASRGSAPCIPTADGSLPAHVVASPNQAISHNTYTNFGPRAGVAYQLNSKTVIRSGFGILFDNWASILQTAQNVEGSWPDVGQQINNTLNIPLPGALTPNIKAENPFPGGNFPAATPFNQVNYFYDPYLKNPYSMQWNFGVEHQFNTSTVLTVNYVGSGTRRADIGGSYNTALTPGPGTPQLRNLYPYASATYYDRSIGKDDYEGLQVIFNRRFQGGLAYQFQYTYSKAIDDGASDYYGISTLIANPYQYQNARSVSSFDLTHVFSSNILYELPFGNGRHFKTGNRITDYAIGGWQSNGLITARSGLPYSVTATGDIANTGNPVTYETGNLVGDPALSNPTRQQWLNKAAFQIPAVYTFGTSGRDILRSQASYNVDFSIFRVFTVLEKRSVEFRAEAFNLFNNVVYSAPVSSLTASNFAQVTSTANTPRTLQFGLKFKW